MIKPSGETVLLYNLNNDKGRKLRFVMVRMGMRIRVVNKEEYGLPVGILAGMKEVVPEKEDSDIQDFQDEMMIMKGFTDGRLDQFLKAMRKDGIEKVNYKAVLTPTNCRWNSWQLYQELRKEHETMSGNSRQTD